MNGHFVKKRLFIVSVFVTGFVFAYFFVASVSSVFNLAVAVYLRTDLQSYTKVIWLAGFALSFTLLVFSVLKYGCDGPIVRFLTQTDYSLILITSVSIARIGYSMLKRLTLINGLFVIIPFAVYTAAVIAVIAAVLRIREKSFNKAFHIFGFLKAFPLKTPIGLLFSLLSLINLICITGTLYNNDSLFIGFFLCYAMIIILCKNLVSLSYVYKKASEDSLKSERLKIELIANVSHDIRTPLTSIINYVDLIKRLNIDDQKLSEYIAVLDNKTKRLKTLVCDLIDASKAGTGNVKLNLATVNLTELIGQISGEYDHQFSDRKLEFVLSPAAGQSVNVTADGELLWRIAENIFSNAVKYSMPQTRVYCGLIKSGDKAVLSLKNISKEPLNISPDELTERFVRGDRSRSGDGNGLGLYIAKSLAELMGAEFEIIINGDLFEVVIRFYVNKNEKENQTWKEGNS